MDLFQASFCSCSVTPGEGERLTERRASSTLVELKSAETGKLGRMSGSRTAAPGIVFMSGRRKSVPVRWSLDEAPEEAKLSKSDSDSVSPVC